MSVPLEETGMADGEELDLDTLNDAELVEQMHDDLYDGLRAEIEAGTRILLARGWSAAPGRSRCSRSHG